MEKMNEELSENLKKYYSILGKYRNGDFGEAHISLYEILVLANDIDLSKYSKIYFLDKPVDRTKKIHDITDIALFLPGGIGTIEELDYLITHNTGFIKLMFSELKKKRFPSDNMVLSLNKGGSYEN